MNAALVENGTIIGNSETVKKSYLNVDHRVSYREVGYQKNTDN